MIEWGGGPAATYQTIKPSEKKLLGEVAMRWFDGMVPPDLHHQILGRMLLRQVTVGWCYGLMV